MSISRRRRRRSNRSGTGGWRAGRQEAGAFQPPASSLQPRPDNSYETPSRTSKTGPRHRASHRDAAEPGDGAAPPRAPDDDRAAGQGAAAVRRAAHHRSPSAALGGRRRRTARRAARPPPGHAGPAGSRGRDQAVRHDRAAVRRAARRLHAPAAPRLPQGRRAEVAQVELVGSEFNPAREGRSRGERRAKASSRRAKGVGGRLRAAAERLRGKKEEQGGPTRRRPSGPPERRVAQGDHAAEGRRQLGNLQFTIYVISESPAAVVPGSFCCPC